MHWQWNWNILSIPVTILVGCLAGIYYVKLIKKQVLGDIWGAMVVGVIGCVLGGQFLHWIIFNWLTNNPLNVDFVADLFGAFLLIWIFSKLSRR